VQSDPRVIEAYIGTGRETAADDPAAADATPAAPDVPLAGSTGPEESV